jgi:hypothetical protein
MGGIGNIKELKDLDLFPLTVEGVDSEVAYKNHLLFTKIDGVPHLFYIESILLMVLTYFQN